MAHYCSRYALISKVSRLCWGGLCVSNPWFNATSRMGPGNYSFSYGMEYRTILIDWAWHTALSIRGYGQSY